MKVFVLLLSLLVAGSQAGKLATLTGFTQEEIIERISPPQSANLNYYVDRAIPSVLNFMYKNGLDPMTMPDVTEGFSVRPLLITYSALLFLEDGVLHNLDSIRRSGDAHVHYFANMLRVSIVVEFRELEFNFNYRVQVMNLGPSGGVVGSVNHVNANLEVLVDFNNDEIHLQDFVISHIGNIGVRLTGNILIDWLMTPVVNLITTLFRGTIMRIVERNVRDEIQNVINGINANLKDL